ncbi:MAG: hypothetical protein NVS9B7_29330 [Flavisolibacter sp.]
MKTIISKYLFNLSVKFIKNRIADSFNLLTPDYLQSIGWIKEYVESKDSYMWVEQNIKDRDKIWIEFESHYYRVWYGADRIFIACESSKEWFEIYYNLMIH